MAAGEENINEAERMIQEIQKVHNKIEQHEKKQLPKKHKAVKQDIKKFKDGDITEKRMKRILQEIAEEEEEQEKVIQTESKSIQETREALKDLRKTINKIKQNQNNEQQMFKGIEDAMGDLSKSLGEGDFKGAVDNVIDQMWDTVGQMDTDVNAEAEMAEDLDILGHEIGRTVMEEEEIGKFEKKEFELDKMAGQLFVAAGSKEGKKRDEELAEEDREEFEQTSEEVAQTEELTALEEKDISDLNHELEVSVNEAEEMKNEVIEIKRQIQNAPGNNRERIEKLNSIEDKLNSEITKVKRARKKLNDANNYTNQVEQEERSAENFFD